MSMRPAPRMNRTRGSNPFTRGKLFTTLLPLLSLALTVGSVALAYMAIRTGNTFNIRDAFLAIFGLLLVVAVNS